MFECLIIIMDIIRDSRAESLLAKAIQTNDLDTILRYKDLCDNQTGLPVSDQVKMPAIALALHSLCSDIKPYADYTKTNEQQLIPILVKECGVNPNALFRIYGETKPPCMTRTPSVPEETVAVPGYYEEHTPLSLLLSYYIEHGEIDEYKIRECMKQLFQLGADPCTTSFYIIDKHNRKRCSLLMASLQSRLTRYNPRIDFFRFLLENGARFSSEDEAPLANYLHKNYVLSVQLLTLFLEYRNKRQITPNQILDPIFINGNRRDAMYIWCNSEPLDPFSDKSREVNLLLALGFDPVSGFAGIQDALQKLPVPSNNSDPFFTLHRRIMNKYESLRQSLETAVQRRNERMKNVTVLQSLEANGLLQELQETVFMYTGGNPTSLAQAEHALEKHKARLKLVADAHLRARAGSSNGSG